MTALDELIAALRVDMDQLLKVAEREDNRNRQAALRLAVKLIGTTVDKFEPEPSAWPDDWDDFATCVRCGRKNSPSLATTNGGLMCHPKCLPTLLYRIADGRLFSDLVIEVPAEITEPGPVATWLADRASLMIRHQIGGEYAVDVMVDLDGGFVSVVVDNLPDVRYPLIEASRTEIGGAK